MTHAGGEPFPTIYVDGKDENQVQLVLFLYFQKLLRFKILLVFIKVCPGCSFVM